MRYLRYTRGLYLLAGGTPAGGALQEESEDRTEEKVKSQGLKGKLRKITTKLGPSLRTIRNQVEWKSHNYGIKETTSIHWVGRVETWNGLVPHPCAVDKNLEGISQEQGFPAPHQASSKSL